MQRNQGRSKGSEVNRQKSREARIGIAVAEFNADVTEILLAGALRELRASGVPDKNIAVMRVPGSFELPLTCQQMARGKKYDGLIALGCVIKGETDHYHYIAAEAARGIMDAMLTHDIPIGFGVLTTDTLAQAKARASGKNNKGGEAARAVLEMIALVRKTA